MKRALLGKKEIDRIKAHVSKHKMSLAIIRTDLAPPGLSPLFAAVGKACGMAVRRTMSSPLSDFGFAELDSDGRILLILYIGGECTELVTVSEIDETGLRDLEDSLHLSNFQSELVRLGL